MATDSTVRVAPRVIAPPTVAPRQPALLLARAVLAVAACAVAWWLWRSRGYVPIWDARVYADCAVRAATEPFALGALRCAGHPSHAYFLIISTLQRLAPGSMPLVLLANGLLLAVGAFALARLLRRTFPSPALAPERLLLVAALLVDPVVVASAVQLNPDFGILVFLLAATAAAAEGRYRLAALCGLLASFSKETGPILYGALVGAFAVAALLPERVPRATRNALLAVPLTFLLVTTLLPWSVWSVPVAALATLVVLRSMLGPAWAPTATLRALARRMPLAIVALPLVAFLAYMAWRATLARTSQVWAGVEAGFVVRMLVTPHFLPESVTYLGQIFLLNFHWIAGAAVLVDLLVGTARFAAGRPPRAVPGADPAVLSALTVFGVGAIYLITRIPAAPIARYMTPVFPVLGILFLAALLRLGLPQPARRAVLALFVLLLAASVDRTRDPLSKLAWGTYPVGTREMIRTNSNLPVRAHFGLDEGLYNLEFLRIAQLSQRALDRLHPVRDLVLVTGIHANWSIVGPLDAHSQRRLWGRPLEAPRLAHAEDLIAGRVLPDSAWYLAYPYIPNAPLLARLGARYIVGAPERIDIDGYGMVIRTLRRRGAAPTPAPHAP